MLDTLQPCLTLQGVVLLPVAEYLAEDAARKPETAAAGAPAAAVQLVLLLLLLLW